MNLLYRYSKQYWKLFVAALLLAATNQIFSLLDPLIFRHVIDSYATRFKEYTTGQFVRGVSFLLFLAVSVAMLPCRSAIIDAEVVACGEDGRPDFYALMAHAHDNLCAWCFDLLEINESRRPCASLLRDVC